MTSNHHSHPSIDTILTSLIVTLQVPGRRPRRHGCVPAERPEDDGKDPAARRHVRALVRAVCSARTDEDMQLLQGITHPGPRAQLPSIYLPHHKGQRKRPFTEGGD